MKRSFKGFRAGHSARVKNVDRAGISHFNEEVEGLMHRTKSKEGISQSDYRCSRNYPALPFLRKEKRSRGLIYGREMHPRVSHRLDITALGARGKTGKKDGECQVKFPFLFFYLPVLSLSAQSNGQISRIASSCRDARRFISANTELIHVHAPPSNLQHAPEKRTGWDGALRLILE